MASKANLTAVISAVDKVSGPMKRIQRSLRQPVRAFAGLGKSVANVGGRISGILGPLGALGGALSVAGLVNTVNGFARGADEVSKFSRQLGLSAEAYQELRFAADRQGVSQDNFNTALSAFSKRLGELKAGTGSLHTMLEKVNPELADQLRSATDTEEAFSLMIDSLDRLEGQENKAALAASAFGRSGMEMVRVAEAGQSGIDALRKEARRLGVVIDNDTARAAEGFVDSLTNMEASLTGVKNLIGGTLMPQIQPAIDSITKWTVENREFIASSIADVVTAIADAIKEIDVEKTKESFKSLKTDISSFVDSIGGWKGILIGLVAFMNAPLIAAIASVGVAFLTLSKTLLTNPVGLAIIVLIYLARQLIEHWDKVTAWWDKLWGAFTQTFQGAWKVIDGLVNGDMAQTIQGLEEMWEGIGTFWNTLFDGIAASVRELVSDFEWALSIASKAKSKFTGVKDAFLGFFSGDDEAPPVDNSLKRRAVDRVDGPSSLYAQNNRVEGQMNVTVQAPQGYRVAAETTGDFEMNADVGDRRLSPVGSM